MVFKCSKSQDRKIDISRMTYVLNPNLGLPFGVEMEKIIILLSLKLVFKSICNGDMGKK